jgi:hypothetical protein
MSKHRAMVSYSLSEKNVMKMCVATQTHKQTQNLGDFEMKSVCVLLLSLRCVLVTTGKAFTMNPRYWLLPVRNIFNLDLPLILLLILMLR